MRSIFERTRPDPQSLPNQPSGSEYRTWSSSSDRLSASGWNVWVWTQLAKGPDSWVSVKETPSWTLVIFELQRRGRGPTLT